MASWAALISAVTRSARSRFSGSEKRSGWKRLTSSLRFLSTSSMEALGTRPSLSYAARTLGGYFLGVNVVVADRHPQVCSAVASCAARRSSALRHSSEAPFQAASKAPYRASLRSRPVRSLSRKRSSSCRLETKPWARRPRRRGMLTVPFCPRVPGSPRSPRAGQDGVEPGCHLLPRLPRPPLPASLHRRQGVRPPPRHATDRKSREPYLCCPDRTRRPRSSSPLRRHRSLWLRVPCVS